MVVGEFVLETLEGCRGRAATQASKENAATVLADQRQVFVLGADDGEARDIM